jgi:trehalose-6-phosphatase
MAATPEGHQYYTPIKIFIKQNKSAKSWHYNNVVLPTRVSKINGLQCIDRSGLSKTDLTLLLLRLSRLYT